MQVVQAQVGMDRGEEVATASVANPFQKLERNWRRWREVAR